MSSPPRCRGRAGLLLSPAEGAARACTSPGNCQAAQRAGPLSEEHTFSTARRKPLRRRPQSLRPLACPAPRRAPCSFIICPSAGGDCWCGLFLCPTRLAAEEGQKFRGRGEGSPLSGRCPAKGGGGLLTAAARGLHHLGSRARLKGRPPSEGGVRGAEGSQSKVSNQISGLDLTLEHINGGAA